jgi:hypothetical protein
MTEDLFRHLRIHTAQHEDKHPELRHEDYMIYRMKREDLVKECSEKLFPFVNKYDCRIDCLVDEIEDILIEKIAHEDTVD